MTLRKKRLKEFIADEKEGAKEYSEMAKQTNNVKFKTMYREMARDERKHYRMLIRMLKQEPC